MLEVDKKLVRKWSGTSQPVPIFIDMACPYENCHKSLVNARLEWSSSNPNFNFAAVVCASCERITKFFLVDPPKTDNEDDFEKCRLIVVPPQPIVVNFQEEVLEVSSDFVKIYKQAAEAEFMKLDSIAGVGYRKALEFLIKDYLIGKYSEKGGKIGKAHLSDCIKDYVDDPNVKITAEKAAWIGNDETHYVRIWQDKDIEDLKILLTLTANWISSEILTSRYADEMQKSKNGGMP
jgi:hypothetical protein